MTRILLAWVGVLSATAFALPEFSSIQERAQGQSLSGSAVLNDSLYSNPASSAFTPAYTFEAIYALPKTFGVSVLDTKTSGIGGALGYFRKNTGGPDTVQGAKIALSGRLAEDLAVGIGGKTLWAPGRHMNDVDLGALYNLGIFQLGLTTRNLFHGSAELDQPREWSFGGRVNYQNTLFFSGASYSKWSALSPYQIGFGAEYVSPYYFSLKGGYRFQPGGRLTAWSAGFSFLAPKLGLHYAVDFPSGSSMEHILGVTLAM